jgi:hypothetical protein
MVGWLVGNLLEGCLGRRKCLSGGGGGQVVDNTVRRGGKVGQSKAIGQHEAVLTTTMTTLTTTRGEEAIATITIMTTITTMKAGGGCKGMAHPGVGTTYDIVMIVPNTNTRSSLMTTLALGMVVVMATLPAVGGGLIYYEPRLLARSSSWQYMSLSSCRRQCQGG